MYFEANKSVFKKMAVSMYLYRLFHKESVKLKSIIGDKDIDINIFWRFCLAVFSYFYKMTFYSNTTNCRKHNLTHTFLKLLYLFKK